MKLYPVKKCKKGCEADVVAETTVLAYRGRQRRPSVRRAKQVHHARALEPGFKLPELMTPEEQEVAAVRFWHWSDVKVVRI